MSLKIDFVTLFPETFLNAVRYSILKRAEERGLVSFGSINPRDFATDSHKSVDDEPYGGGPGMVMKPATLSAAIEKIKTNDSVIVFTDASGELFKQYHAKHLSQQKHLIFVCGHYEGIDERVVEKYANYRLSVGDYVLTGGELPAAVMAEAVVRLLPGALGSPESLDEDAFGDGLLSYPQYTRPEVWEGMPVPEVLLSGNHAQIASWRRKQRLLLTRRNRPDLFAKAPLSQEDINLLK